MMNAVVPFHPLHDKINYLNKKIKTVLRFVELYKPYSLFKGIFNDRNFENLRRAMNQNEEEGKPFYCDPRCIDWEDYFTKIISLVL
ncbi:hypothetical protein Sjap_001212 [Stephania japonica]|uniref:Fatty acyl-CoA reductase C-terminal domain-containing protein n=1 Tax=Stephania japonica TaxID=461633 RepID=A0AAP0KJJ1_9MAGN